MQIVGVPCPAVCCLPRILALTTSGIQHVGVPCPAVCCLPRILAPTTTGIYCTVYNSMQLCRAQQGGVTLEVRIGQSLCCAKLFLDHDSKILPFIGCIFSRCLKASTHFDFYVTLSQALYVAPTVTSELPPYCMSQNI